MVSLGESLPRGVLIPEEVVAVAVATGGWGRYTCLAWNLAAAAAAAVDVAVVVVVGLER